MVEYSLTPLGQSLIEPLEAICRWAEKHLPELEAARARSQKAKHGRAIRRGAIHPSRELD